MLLGGLLVPLSIYACALVNTVLHNVDGGLYQIYYFALGTLMK